MGIAKTYCAGAYNFLFLFTFLLINRVSGMESTLQAIEEAGSQDMLGSAVARVSSSLATLERMVDSVMAYAAQAQHNQHASEPAPAIVQPESGLDEAELIASVDKWRSRFSAVEKERDELQEMLVALKRRYEDVAKQNHELTQKLTEKEVDYNRLADVVDEVNGRLDISLGLIDEVLNYA
jgi:prefoldin subunit 5